MRESKNKNTTPKSANNSPGEPAIVKKITELSGALPAKVVKRILRDVQYELTSAWKFFMGLGKEKQVLVLVDGLTTLPLSLARSCAYVIVYGLLPDEADLFRELAVEKGISNYSMISDLTTLATKFDLVVSAVTKPENSILFLKKHEVGKLIHENSEFWIITSNQMSFGFVKDAIRSVWKRAKGKKPAPKNRELGGVRFQFGYARPILTRKARAYLEEIDFKPYKTIGLAPTIVDARIAKPLENKSEQAGVEGSKPPWQRLLTKDVVIGASAKEPSTNFLERFLTHIPGTDLKNGKVEKYVISAGGKVLLFVSFLTAEQPKKTIVKLPLNRISERKLHINHRFLEHFSTANEIADTRRPYFPSPLATGCFESQRYFIEDCLPGKSGDFINRPKSGREYLVHEVFAFWVGLQQSYAKQYYIDKGTFNTLIKKPLARVFTFFRQKKEGAEIYKSILSFLRKQLQHREFTLSLIHGDFSEKNIILDPVDLTMQGVIDWDMARQTAFPILDVFYFFVRYGKGSQGRSIVASLMSVLEKKSDELEDVLKMYRESFSIEEKDYPALAIVYWIYRMSGHLDSLKYMEKSFVKRNFTEPLNIFKKIVEDG